MNIKRTRRINEIPAEEGAVLYWMDRDRRMRDNWALIFAQNMAKKYKAKLFVIYTMPKNFLESAWRQHHFMIEGFKELEKDLEKKNIPFEVFNGEPVDIAKKYIKQKNIKLLVTDFTPLKLPRSWREKLAKDLEIPFVEVDARNIIPCWLASDKLEFAAYTIRPKIHEKVEEFLDEFPEIDKHKFNEEVDLAQNDWEKLVSGLNVDKAVKPIDWIKPGEKAAQKVLEDFIESKAKRYSEERNDPNAEVLSNLSPYLHFGHISAQRIASICRDYEDFFEELVVRRELAENYCYYSKDYDNFNGFHEWAQKTLNEHRDDPREYIYTLKKFENAKTHDDLWNAAQMEMVKLGKMHGYMRMYWAKKILEWTNSPEEAQEIAIYLNDKYELDGRDPNGYTGIAWSIGGVHDRAWTERDVYGKVRYMNYNGCKRKFDVDAYIEKIDSLGS